ncbi:1917_t:CDS:2, partial [Dentiscutata heterogama]
MIQRLYFIILLLTFISIVAAICNYNTKCHCRVGLHQGQYCGGQIGQIGCKPTHVYECSPTGKTCDYGYRVSCANCGA